MANVVAMEEAGLKENVNPVGGLWGQPRRVRKLGLGVGAGGGAHERSSSRARGVLAPNTTLGNSGGGEALEWLKDRVTQLVAKGQPEPVSGSRHRHKLSSPSADGKVLEASGKASAGLSSKELSKTLAGREPVSHLSHPSPSHPKASMLQSRNLVDLPEKNSRNHRIGSGLQAADKSQWPRNLGVIEVFQDDSVSLQDERVPSRRELKVKPGEIISPGAAAGSVARGSASRSETEHNSKVSQISPRNALKPQLQQHEVDGKKPSPHLSSRSVGGGVWSGTMRQGTPYKATVHPSRNSADQPERRNRDHQQLGSGGQVSGPKSPWSKNMRILDINNKSSVVSQYRREVSHREVMVDAVETKLPGKVGGRLASRSQIDLQGSQISASACELLKSEIHQVYLKKLFPRDLPNSVESGRSSFAKRHGTPYNRSSPLSAEEKWTKSSSVDHLSQLEAKNLRGSDLGNEEGGGDERFLVPKISPVFQLRNVEHSELDRQIDCGRKAASGDCHSEDRTGQVFAGWSPLPPPAETQSAPTIKAGAGNSKWSRKSVSWNQVGARVSSSENALDGEGSEWNSISMDITAGGPVSGPLPTSEVTGASSSGSSSTRDEDTIKSLDIVHPTPSAEKASSYRFSSSQKLSRINKRSRSLGPASRVLRGEVLESGNSRISPVSVGPVIESNCSASTAEEAEKNDAQLDHPWSDPRKRKAERDLSSGDGDTSQIVDENGSDPESPQEKDVEVHRQLANEDEIGEVARLRLLVKQVSRPTKLQPQISAEGTLIPSEKPSTSLPTTLRVRTVASSGRRSSSSPGQNHKGGPLAPKDSIYRSDGTFVSGRERGHMKLVSDGAPGSAVRVLMGKSGSHGQHLPVGEAGKLSDAISERRGPLTPEISDLMEGREQAVDMSQDGFPAKENKENVPIPVVPDLSNSLGSLCLEGNDMLKKDQSSLPVHTYVKKSPVLSVAPSSHLKTLNALKRGGAPQAPSHSASSVVTMERDSQSPYPSEQPQRKKSAEKAKVVRSSPFLSEKPGGEQLNKAVGLPSTGPKVVAEVRTVPPEKAQDSGASALQSSHGTAAVTSQKKMSENSHFVWVNNKRYQKLGKIGKGGSSQVFKVIDSDCNIYAMKKINLKGREHRAAVGFYQEIEYLERLRGKRNVVQLIDYEVTNTTVIMDDYEEEKIEEDACIYMVLEFGEIDLAGILSKKRKQMLESNEVLDDNWLRFYWKHMLLAVKTIHDERIVHADLKPANFLLVKGELKLIDFGIAKAIQNDTTHIVRDSQVGTLNYMSPEAFMTNSMDEEGRVVKCGRASDIWSLGCILYQMVYGHTPFSQVDSFYAKIQAITSKSSKIDFPVIPDPWLQDVMKKCLTWDRYSRPHITDLLQHPFLRPELASQHKLGVE